MIEAGECDFASVIGVPAAVTIGWLGLPVQDWRQYAAAHHAMLAIEPGSAAYVHAATVEFHSCPMRQGDRVLLSWASANRDPAVFEDPDTVDIERWPNRHAAFGLGIHRCAGAHIARILARTLLGQILERMPDYVIDTERLEPYVRQGVNAGYRQIPARFTPGPRRGADISP